MTKKNIVCPHCGSKQIQQQNGYFTCGKCKNDFGREALTDEGTSMEEAITGLRFRYGDIVRGSVRLRIAQDDAACLFEVYDANEGGVNKIADVLPVDEWNEIKRALVEDMFIQDWQKKYIPNNDGKTIPENNEWELDIDFKDDEQLTFRGYDAYPVYWNALMKHIKPFFNRLAEE